MNEYNFPVEFKKIITEDGLPIRRRQAVVRMDKSEAIGVVSHKYALLPHSDVIDSFRKVLEDEEVREKIKMSHNGARLFYEAVLPNIRVRVKDGDDLEMRLIVKNSYDGSHKFQVMFGAFRLICSNGMIMGRKFLTFDRRHIGKKVDVNLEVVREQVELLKNTFRDSAPILRAMAEMPMPNVEEFFDPKKLKIPAYLAKIAAENYASSEDRTIWGGYNSLTYAITHQMKKENPDAAADFASRAWAGSVRFAQ